MNLKKTGRGPRRALLARIPARVRVPVRPSDETGTPNSHPSWIIYITKSWLTWKICVSPRTTFFLIYSHFQLDDESKKSWLKKHDRYIKKRAGAPTRGWKWLTETSIPFHPFTLPKTNIFAPKNGWVSKFGISKLPGGPYFQGRLLLVSGRVQLFHPRWSLGSLDGPGREVFVEISAIFGPKFGVHLPLEPGEKAPNSCIFRWKDLEISGDFGKFWRFFFKKILEILGNLSFSASLPKLAATSWTSFEPNTQRHGDSWRSGGHSFKQSKERQN